MKKSSLKVLMLLTLWYQSEAQQNIIKNTLFFEEDTILSILTDSSTIEIHFENGRKYIEEFYFDKDLKRFISYYSDNVTIKRESFSKKTSSGNVGKTRTYDSCGSLELIIDNDIPKWTPINTDKYPYYLVLNQMKVKADSIIETIYSDVFIKEQLKWNIFDSYYFDKTSSQPSFSISWLNQDSRKYNSPTEFLVSYDLINSSPRHDNKIQILFDVNGNILKKHEWNNDWTVFNKGLQKLDSKTNRNFVLSENQAIEEAIKCGLKITNDENMSCYLKWESDEVKDTCIYNGSWKIFILNHLKTIQEGSITCQEHYDVWIFDPWTGLLIERKKMYRKVEYGGCFIDFSELIKE